MGARAELRRRRRRQRRRAVLAALAVLLLVALVVAALLVRRGGMISTPKALPDPGRAAGPSASIGVRRNVMRGNW